VRRRRHRTTPWYLQPIGPHRICLDCDFAFVTKDGRCYGCGGARIIACFGSASRGSRGCALCNRGEPKSTPEDGTFEEQWGSAA
jgi:hypothetical protein